MIPHKESIDASEGIPIFRAPSDQEKPMKTYSAKPTDVQKKWILIDANGVVLGRMAAVVATILRGMERTTVVTERPGYLYAQARTRLLRFRVNLLTTHRPGDPAPVIYDTNPTYANLFGYLERRARFGALLTAGCDRPRCSAASDTLRSAVASHAPSAHAASAAETPTLDPLTNLQRQQTRAISVKVATRASFSGTQKALMRFEGARRIHQAAHRCLQIFHRLLRRLQRCLARVRIGRHQQRVAGGVSRRTIGIGGDEYRTSAHERHGDVAVRRDGIGYVTGSCPVAKHRDPLHSAYEEPRCHHP